MTCCDKHAHIFSKLHVQTDDIAESVQNLYSTETVQILYSTVQYRISAEYVQYRISTDSVQNQYRICTT